MDDPVRMGEQPADPLEITVEQATPTIAVVRLTGDLDMLTSPVLRDHLQPLLGPADRAVLIDLSGVDFLGSAGLAELAAANDTATRNGVRLALVATNRAVRRPLEITGLHTVFTMFDSVEAALHQL